jgi:hypothetical protein
VELRARIWQPKTPLSAPRITKQIASVTSLQELNGVLQTYAAELDHIHVAAALSKAVKVRKRSLYLATEDSTINLRPPQQHATWTPWLAQPDQQLRCGEQQEQQPWRLTDAASQFSAQLGLREASDEASSSYETLKGMLLGLIGTHLPSMGSRQLPVVLYSLAKLGWSDQPKLLKQLLQACPPLFNRFTPQGLTNTLYACGLLGLRPSKKWMQLWFRACRRSLLARQFNTQDLTVCSWALGRLLLYPKAEWQVEFLAASQVRRAPC